MNPNATVQLAIVAALKSSKKPITATQVAALIGRDYDATKFGIYRLVSKNLIHSTGSVKAKFGTAKLYKYGPEPAIDTSSIESLMAPWIAAARAKLEQRA